MQEKNRFIRLLASLTASLMLVVLGVLYIISCIEIWRSGASPFTRESIGHQLTKLLIPSLITVAAVIAGFILHILFPITEKKKKRPDPKDVCTILSKTITINECRVHRAKAIINERNRRLFLKMCGLAVFLFSLFYPTIYLLTPGSFGVEDVNTDVLLAALHVILSFIPLTAYCIISSYMISASYSREVEVLRAAIKEHSSVTDDELFKKESSDVKLYYEAFDKIKAFFKKNNKTILTVTRCAVLVIGLVFVVAGIFNGGMRDVLDKAVKICRECIGLG